MRSPYAGDPFTTSTPEIAAALEDVSIPTLLLSLVHITGDPRFIRDFKQMGIFLNEVQGFMSEEDKARARSEALSVITQYRDRGCPEPQPLSPELIREMMDWAACERVPDDYLSLVSEELDLDGQPFGREPLRAHVGAGGDDERTRQRLRHGRAEAKLEGGVVYQCHEDAQAGPNEARVGAATARVAGGEAAFAVEGAPAPPSRPVGLLPGKVEFARTVISIVVPDVVTRILRRENIQQG